MPFDASAPARTACAHDATPPVFPGDLAWRALDGTPHRVAVRAAAMVASLEMNHGPWHPDAAASSAIGKAVQDEMRFAICKMPMLLVSPCNGIRYALLTLAGSGHAVFLLEDGRLLTTTKGLSRSDRHWSRLADDPLSTFHWARDGKVVPCDDPVTAAAFSEIMTETIKHGTRARITPRRRGQTTMRVGKSPSRILATDLIDAAASAAGFQGATQNWGKGLYAANAMATRMERVASAGFELGARLLLDPAMARLASAAGNEATYEWLLGLDAEPDLVGTVAARRRQFCRGYPELAGALAMDAKTRTRDVAPERQEALQTVAAAVDGAGKLAPAVAAMRKWEPWVEKALRGRLAADRRLGQGAPLDPDPTRNGDILAQALGKLGPAWRIRHGDEHIAMPDATGLRDGRAGKRYIRHVHHPRRFSEPVEKGLAQDALGFPERGRHEEALASVELPGRGGHAGCSVFVRA
jgi:hypothetical protein